MFDKNKFALILKKINDTYESQRTFSKKSGINRTYLSQYANMKLNEPPKPIILEKLANASNGLASYNELMFICGYIESINDDLSVFEDLKQLEQEHLRNYKFLFNSKEREIYNVLHDRFFLSSEKSDEDILSALEEFDCISQKSKIKIYNKLKESFDYWSKKELIESKISDPFPRFSDNKEINQEQYNISEVVKFRHFKQIPIIGKISAGQPILTQETIEGYLPINPSIYGVSTAEDLFFLRVSGQSMNLKVKNGDYALIKKQDYAENGDIVVAIVNGDSEATLKRYKKLNEQFVLLEPMSSDPSIEAITVDLKTTDFHIIGKAIGQFGKF